MRINGAIFLHTHLHMENAKTCSINTKENFIVKPTKTVVSLIASVNDLKWDWAPKSDYDYAIYLDAKLIMNYQEIYDVS